jgi:hypothetical protein
MTLEQQRIAIAEACGWRQSTAKHPKSGNIVKVWTDGKRDWSHNPRIIPDYPNNLNAMHEAEKMLNSKMLWETYKAHLLNWMTEPICSTAAQRAEAFLRTVGRWKE